MVDAWAEDELDERVSDDVLLTGEAVALDLRPTGLVLSAVGAVIDFAVYLGFFIAVILVFVTIAAQPAVELLSHGKSLGRLAVGARIVRDDGGAIGFRHVGIRAVAGFLEIFATAGGIALVVGLLSPRSKRFGDLLAGTYSQYERVGKAPTPAFGMPTPLVNWAATADVARMPDGLSRRISQFLAQAPSLDSGRRTTVASGLAQEASAYVSPVPPVAPELFLAGVTVVRRAREAEALAAAARRLETLDPALRGVPHQFPDRG